MGDRNFLGHSSLPSQVARLGPGPGHPVSERLGTLVVTVTILIGTASRSSPSRIGYQLGDGVTGDGSRLELPVRELEGRLAH